MFWSYTWDTGEEAGYEATLPNRRGYLCPNVAEYRSTMYHDILFTQVWIRMGGYRKCVIPTKPVVQVKEKSFVQY